MKTIGILGGMSAASTQTYYKELCDLTRSRLGGLHSPEWLIRSLDFDRLLVLLEAIDTKPLDGGILAGSSASPSRE